MVFLNEKNIRFFKLSALILGPGNSVVTNNLSEKVRAEQLTFPEFLNKKKHYLFHLYKKSLCHFSYLIQIIESLEKAFQKTNGIFFFARQETNAKMGKQNAAACMTQKLT